MPYCSLTEDTIIEHAKMILENNSQLKVRADLDNLYNTLQGWNKSSFCGIYDRKVAVGKFKFKARLIGHGETMTEKGAPVLEQAVEYTAMACNDELLSIATGEKYLYCAYAGEETVDGFTAQELGSRAAFRIFAEQFAGRGFILDRCVVEEWEYVGRNFDGYTRYEIPYKTTHGTDTLVFVGYGNKVILCSNPEGYVEKPVVPEEPERKLFRSPKWIAILAGAGVGIALLSILITLLIVG